MRIVIILVALFFLVGCKKNINDVLSDESCKSLEVIETYVKKDSVSIIELEENVLFLEILTGIKSKGRSTFIGVPNPNKENYLDWMMWLERHNIKCE